MRETDYISNIKLHKNKFDSLFMIMHGIQQATIQHSNSF